MDAIKAQLLRMQQQLAGLSASQKMLTASLVVIMVMTMFYWSRYAGTAEMEALLDQSLSAEEISTIKTALQSKGVKYTVTGDRIMVPADRRAEALVDLSFMQMLPKDMKGFDDIFAKMSPLDSGEKTKEIANHGKQHRLEWVISRWPGVKTAVVWIDGNRKMSPIRPVEPTASIDVILKPGAAGDKHLGDAIINLVTGAQAGLDRKNIRVTINGRAHKPYDPNNPFAADGSIFDQKVKWENYYKDKINEQIVYIQGAVATVSVELDASTKIEQARTVDPKATIQISKKDVSTSTETTQAAPGGEPGAVPNQGLILEQQTQQASAGTKSTSEKTETENVVDYGSKSTTTQTPAGDGVAVAAGLRVPESYFRSMWKMRNGGGQTEPTDAELEAIVQKELPRLRDDVKRATNIKDDAAVSVAMYVDVSQPTMSGDAAAASGLAAMPLGIGFGAKEIAIGALAIISLFMVSMMVRKSVPAPVMPALAPTPIADLGDGIPGDVTVGSDLAGEVGAGGMLLTGREMSEDQIEAQQVIEQVGTMVKENPDVAANLVKRWLNRD